MDEANLVLDRPDQVYVFLVAGLLAPGGFVGPDGVPDLPRLHRSLGARIARLPPLSLRVVRAGRRHRWEPAALDLRDHVRLAEPVAGPSGFERRCADLMRTPLPRDRPLWEVLLVPGAAPDHLGIVFRIHHALADGTAAAGIVRELFDPAADRRPSAGPPAGASTVDPAPGRPAAGLRGLGDVLRGPRVRATVLLGDQGPRGVAFLGADLTGIAGRVRPDATVNDALLAGVAAGLRAALTAAGEPVPPRFPVSVPVALPRGGTEGNQVGIMLVGLPLAEPDADRRLRLIAERTRAQKAAARARGTLGLMRGPLGASLLDRIARRQRLVGAFVTNVPGPREALSLAGAPLTDLWPVAILSGNVRLTVAAVSHAGRLGCGIHFDTRVPGPGFARAMAAELGRLGG